MKIERLAIDGVLLLTPRRFGDARGWFAETWSRGRWAAAGLDFDWCQDNHSFSARAGTLRGLHAQRPPSEQAKLVRCIRGRIWDVAVDMRAGSPSRGRWVGAELGAAEGRQLLIPRGFLHGFLTLEPDTEVLYKVDAPWEPGAELTVAWDDPSLAIAWPLAEAGVEHPILSEKDAAGERAGDVFAKTAR